jgi:hypothetical protein
MSGDTLNAMSNVKTHGWVILTKRYSADIRGPTAAQLSDALRELFDPGVDDEEHGAASLRYGNDDGPMFVMEFTCGRIARFEEWADQDYGRELAPPRETTVNGDAEALCLWTLLASGDLQAVRNWHWKERPAP